jgi:polysaccharide biosynthesis/export protein
MINESNNINQLIIHVMNNKILIQVIVFASMAGLFSCRSTREFTYLQNISSGEHISGKPNEIKEYKLRPNDNLYVSIKTLNPEVNQLFEGNTAVSGSMVGTDQMYGSNVAQYINGYQIDSLGTILLPILGTIEVEGLTIKQVSEKIQKKSLQFLKDPAVKVKLLSFKINVDGEVKNPGVYYSYNEKLTILEAISMAKGVTDNAKIRQTTVIRQTNNGPDTYSVDLTSKSLFASNAYYLQPNDMIYIAPGRNKSTDMNLNSWSLILTTIATILLAVNIFK